MHNRSNQGERVTRWLLSSLFVPITSIAALNCSSSSPSASGAGGNKSSGGSVGTGGAGGAAGGHINAGGVTAAGGSIANGVGGSASTFTAIYTSIIGTSCLPCHSTGNGALLGMLDMSTQQNAYTNLVGSSGTGVAARGMTAGASGTTCASIAGLLRVAPSNASSSLIWEKVNSKLQATAAPCGSPMPAGAAAALTSAQVDQIAAWISSGALNN
jgi:hypothetical protein